MVLSKVLMVPGLVFMPLMVSGMGFMVLGMGLVIGTKIGNDGSKYGFNCSKVLQ